MGKRSRQRAGADAAGDPVAAASSAKAKKRELRRQASEAGSAAERRLRERPSAPWDPFPLTELAILVGIILLGVGIALGSSTGRGLAAAGAVLACIGGLETALREQLAGFRSHSGLLAGALTLASLLLTSGLLSLPAVVSAAIAVGVFAVAFPVLRRSFVRKSGGVGVL